MSESHWCQCENCTAERIRLDQQLAEARAENERLDKKLRKCAGQCKHLSEEYADCADKYNKLRKEHEALQQAAVVYIDAKNNAPAGYDDDAEATAFDNLAALAKGGEGRC